MKKRLALTAALILLLSALCVPAQATPGGLDYVTDAAGLLTDAEWETLETKARSLSDRYQCGVYIVTVDDFTDYVYSGDVFEAAKTIYREYDLGWGEEKSGVMLLLSMAERDYSLISYGYGNTAFNSYGKDKVTAAFLDDFKYNDWYDGLTDYLDKCEELLQAARAGKPLTARNDPGMRRAGRFLSVPLGIFLSLIVSLILRRRMKSVRPGVDAHAYVSAGSVAITRREDFFTHTTQTRVKIEKKSGSSSSGGFSGKSGKF